MTRHKTRPCCWCKRLVTLHRTGEEIGDHAWLCPYRDCLGNTRPQLAWQTRGPLIAEPAEDLP